MRSKIKLFFKIGAGLTFLGGMTYLAYKFLPKMSLKEYTKACLYIAVMDDEICRNELEGNFIEGEEIIFPNKKDSLKYKYDIFLKTYKTYSKKKLEEEIQMFESRLEESKKYINEPKVELNLNNEE